eukprot:5692851-Pleurochrysis_carterae.AAC.3
MAHICYALYCFGRYFEAIFCMQAPQTPTAVANCGPCSLLLRKNKTWSHPTIAKAARMSSSTPSALAY